MLIVSLKQVCFGMLLIVVMIFPTSFAAETGLRNAGFEDDELGRVPSGWFAPKVSLDAGYRVSISDAAQTGKRCALIERDGTEKQKAFGNLL